MKTRWFVSLLLLGGCAHLPQGGPGEADTHWREFRRNMPLTAGEFAIIAGNVAPFLGDSDEAAP